MATKDLKKIGLEGEAIAAKFLKKNGYKILRSNYVCNLGEIDIIALHKKNLVFIEVKGRSSDHFGPPEISVTRHKRRQIIRAAQAYMSRNRIKDIDCRFDVIAINYHPANKEGGPEIRLLSDAFRADDV